MGDIGLEPTSEESPQPLVKTYTYNNSPNDTKREMVHNMVHQTHCQPELQQIIDRRDELPEHIRQTIKMLVDAAGEKAD